MTILASRRRYQSPASPSFAETAPDIPGIAAHFGQTGVMSDDGWYFDVKTGKVTQGKDPNALNRMGPYPDRETAMRALEIAAARNKAADDADEEWNN
ncbi:Uncharacterised protein [Rhodococcus coprophilus]|uniref:Uncharacterized protein n=2 Tax=Rhodococcus coprophilus TaxID=38310 RepID=A0A2X4UVE9_9NOCA|nr:Uncharacterised protein [Rhodococcus coprophilus]